MGNNLNILADLEAKEQEFISVRELFERIRLLQPHVTDAEIAKWLSWLTKTGSCLSLFGETDVGY